MKVDYKIVKKRRDDIMLLIQKLGSISVETLSNEFNISPITIRRDLQYWEDQGSIIRYHGGAKLITPVINAENNFLTNDRYKHAIAKYAAQFVDDGDIIFINTSSTALLVINYIVDKRVTVITNNAKAATINHDPKVSIFLTGGELRTPKNAMVGEFALNTLNKVKAIKTFIGCSGINIEDGVTTALQGEVSINETMIKRTLGAVFVLADYTKIGTSHNFISSRITDINYLITDINADPTFIQQLEDNNVNTVLLPPLNNIVF